MSWKTRHRSIYYEGAPEPDDLDLKPGAPVKKLELVGGKTYSGNAADKFVEARLFDFAPLDEHPPHRQRHVGLPGTNPHVAGQEICQRDGVFAFNREVGNGAGL